MELTSIQMKRCIKLLYLVSVMLSFFFAINGVSFYREGKSGAMVSIISCVASVLVNTAIYFTGKRTKRVYRLLLIMFMINYTTCLFCFDEAYYYSYIVPILSITVLLQSVSLVNILATLTFIINISSFIMKGMRTNQFYTDERVYTSIMLIVTGIVFSFSTKYFIRFVKESTERIVHESDKNRETVEQVTTSVNSIKDRFSVVKEELEMINKQAEQNFTSMKVIAGSSEENAIEISSQVMMTTEIQGAIEVTNDNVHEVHTTTEDVLGFMENGVETVNVLMQQSENVNANMNEMRSIAKKLVDQVGEVSNITKTIMSISDQTDLLALNASIEAAQAGDAGRGFSIVAIEIRDLSAATKEAIDQIDSIICELNEVTNNTIKILDESLDSILVENESINTVNSNFKNSGSYMGQLKDRVDLIVKDVADVEKFNQKIVSSINELSASTEEISNCAQESSYGNEKIMNNMEKFAQGIQGLFEELDSLVLSLKEKNGEDGEKAQ